MLFMVHVPRSKIFDDIYFSVEDGPAETKYVFLDGNNLPARFAEKEVFTICETGFGTGLNFLIAWKALEESKLQTRLNFISFEKYPLNGEEIRSALSTFFYSRHLCEGRGPEKTGIDSRLRGNDETGLLDRFLSKYPEEETGIYCIEVTEKVKLTLIFGDMNEEIPMLNERVDAWFLDGFAPAKNPEMWTETLFENMARLSIKGSTFATFTAAGIVRRGLTENGFRVEKVKGVGCKRNMMKGVYDG